MLKNITVRGELMKKKTLYVLAAIFAVLLCGVGVQYYFFGIKEADFTAKGAIQEAEYRENETLKEKFLVTSHFIPCEENEYIGANCVYGEWVYYSLDYQMAFENPEGNRVVPDFSEQYQTQIRARNMETGEDKMLYKYDADRCVQVSWMDCNGEDLIWTDLHYGNVVGWRLFHMKTNESDEPEIILQRDQTKETLWDITPKIYGNRIFWYDLLEDEEEYKRVVYEYNLDTGKQQQSFANVSFSSPYEHISLVDGIMTTYQYEDEKKSVIHIEEKKRERRRVTVPKHIRDAISNRKMCVWANGDNYYNDSENIMIYDFSSGKVERINKYFFNYDLTENFLIVNRREAVYAYDVEKKEYAKLLEADEEESSFGYISDGADGSLESTRWEEWTQQDGLHIYVIREHK